MADCAKCDTKDGMLVYAKDLHPDEVKNHIFYCQTKGCPAKMYPYAIGTPLARFSSYDITTHISSACIGRDLVYDPHKYDESLFNRDRFFDFRGRNTNSSSGSAHDQNTIRISNAPKTAVNTVLGLYTIFSHKGIGAQYNGYCINDMFACIDNADQKSHGFTGGMLAEGTFYKYSVPDHSLFLDFPRWGKEVGLLKLRFPSSVDLRQYVWKHFKMDPPNGSHRKVVFNHSRLLVVAGTWNESQDSGVIAECAIHTQRQIAFVDNKR